MYLKFEMLNFLKPFLKLPMLNPLKHEYMASSYLHFKTKSLKNIFACNDTINSVGLYNIKSADIRIIGIPNNINN